MMVIHEATYRAELEEAAKMKPAKPVIYLLLAIIAFILFAIVWAAVTQVEELTRGNGQVTPSQDIQIVQSLEGGILQEILVKEGDMVKKDQILLRISDILFSSEERGTQAKLLGLEAKTSRLLAESQSEDFIISKEIEEKIPDIVANERALYQSRQKELMGAYAIQDENIKKAQADLAEVSEEINRLTQSRKLLNDELTITKEMVIQRAVPKLDQLRLERERADISGQIKAREEEKKGLESQLASAKSQRDAQKDKFRSMALEELGEVKTQIASLKENLRSMGDRVDRTEVRAPVDGIVNQIKLSTIGGVVEPAMKLVEIVPSNDTLKIIAQVKPTDIAFLKVGQSAKVKISAYDPQIYGALDGVLSRVSANSVTDKDGNIMFEIEVQTKKSYLGSAENPLPITAGMVADIEIITGKRTILNYLLKPLRRGFNRALRER